MICRPPRSTRTAPLCPFTTLFRSLGTSLSSPMEGGEGIPQTSPLIWRLPQHSPDSTPKLTFTDPKTHRRLPQHSRDSTPKLRSEEHTSKLQSLMRRSYSVFRLKKKKKPHTHTRVNSNHTIILNKTI